MNWASKLLLVAALLVVMAEVVMQFGRHTEPTHAQAPPSWVYVITGCDVGSTPTYATFDFTAAAPWDAAWIDLSLQNNGFAPGTYLSAGPLDWQYNANALPDRRYQQGPYLWSHLKPGLTHYFRVNLLYGGQWYPSATQSFFIPTSCGGASLPPTAPTVSLDLEGQVYDLESRLDDLEACLGSFPSIFCSNRLNDIEGRLDDLEWRLR
jgi:hypothetical protein